MPVTFAVAIETLCSLIRTARLFHSSAKRALLHDPTRALVNNKIVWLWHRMSSLMQELLRKPALGLHVKRLDYFPEYWYLLEVGGASDLDYSNWILTLGLLCPSIFSLTVPVNLPKGSAAAAAFRSLARRSDPRHLRLELADDEDELWSRCLNRCQDFLAGLDLSRCESLQLPPIDGENSGPPHRAPILISTKCLIVQECFEVSDPDFLSRYFDLRNVRSVEIRPSDPETMNLSLLRSFPPTLETLVVHGTAVWLRPAWNGMSFPRLTQLTLHSFVLDLGDLVDIVRRFPVIRSLDFTRSMWTDDSITDRVWLESLPSLRHLQTLRTGTIYCKSTSACTRIRKAITGYCHRNSISVTCRVKRRAARSGSFSSVDTDSELCDGTPRGVCCGDPPDLDEQQSVGDFEDQQNRSEDDDGDWVISDWLRGVSVADSDVPDCERFNRDGVPWHWVFDARGRPTAVPDDLAFYPPAAASADEAALSDDEDDVGTEASVEYLPPFPDAPRLEDGYEAHDADDDDGEGDGFGPEPWLTWSEFCDFDAADSAWVRFDIDDEGEEMSSSEGEVNAEEECESEDDELVSEDGLPPRF
jgi:hypothetical protein